MRKNCNRQRPLSPLWPRHALAQELAVTSKILDANPRISQLVLQDLSDNSERAQGAPGLSGEQVLRCAVLKNWQGLSYRKLAFHLADSMSFRNFSRLPLGWTPTKSCLQENISRIRPCTWEQINQTLIQWAHQKGLEKGHKIRFDSTGVKSPIRHPLDSQLLYDSIRKITALLRALRAYHPVLCVDHCRRAKRRCINLRNARGKQRKKVFYKDLLKVARKTAHYARLALKQASHWEDVPSRLIVARLRHYLQLLRRVIDQTQRRVLGGEKVPAAQKVVSIFQEHTDILQKGGRETTFGHKVFLNGGPSALMLDCRVVRGNPSDHDHLKPMIERHYQLFGHYPRQASFDGGFAGQDNLRWPKVRVSSMWLLPRRPN